MESAVRSQVWSRVPNLRGWQVSRRGAGRPETQVRAVQAKADRRASASRRKQMTHELS